MRVALLPSYVADAIGSVDAPDGTQVVAFDDPGALDAEVLAAVGFYVPPYLGGARGLAPLARMPRLEVCQTLTAGVDDALRVLPAGVTLCNAAGVHDASTAELAVGLALARLRRLDEFARAQPAGEWRSGRYESLADKRVLVVGAGGIGRAVADRLRPFETDVVLVGRTARREAAYDVRATADLADLLPTADVVVLAVPLTEETRGLADADFLARMRDGALLVNVARGPVVVTDALLAELVSGRLHAAVDVTDPEPLPPDHPLWRAPNLLISPHVGGNTSAFLPRARRLVAAQLSRWFAGEPLEHVVVRG